MSRADDRHVSSSRPGTPAGDRGRATRPTGSGSRRRRESERLDELVERIDELQYRLFAEDRRSVLLVLQGLDASGKDGVVRRGLPRRQPARA